MDKKQIKLADVACVDNRKMEGIEELAANIAALGLLQPILLTNEPEKSEGGKPYGVVDGRRRFRALEHLKREFLEPGEYVIFQGGITKEREAAFCANFARQNLTLAEEVEALKSLGGSQRSIAALLGKTEQWVALRQNLANLEGLWVEVLFKPEEYPQWSAAKLELVARETPEVQEYLARHVYSNLPIKRIMEMAAEKHRLLSAAPFDTAECRNCPKRTGAQGLLFAELNDKHDSCLDAECFSAKALELVKKLRTDKKLIPVRGDLSYVGAEHGYADKCKALYSRDYNKLRKPQKGEEPNAIIVNGAGIGKLMVVETKRKATASVGGAKNQEKHEKTVAEREAELKAKRAKLALGKLKAWLGGKANTAEAWIKRSGYAADAVHEMCVKYAVWFGVDGEIDYQWDWQLPDWTKITNEIFHKSVFVHAVKHFDERICEELARTLANIDVKCGDDICGLLFLDWNKQFFEPAVAEIPEPKSLIAARIKEKQAKAEKKSAKGIKAAKASGK